MSTFRSEEVLSTMLKREPPDGKEKPEPPKHQKLETLSRKNSKCDVLDTRQGPPEAAGAGDTGSVLSGSTGSGQPAGQQQAAGHALPQPHTPLAKTESASSKRDSLSAKEASQGFLDSASLLQDEEQDRIKEW